MLGERSVIELAATVRAGELDAGDVVEAALARIDERNPQLGAFVFVDAERARAMAADIDRRVAAGEDPGPLAGVPFGVKELEDVEGWPHTLASKVFADRIATTTSTQVTRLVAAGAIPIGLTASPELGTATHTASLLRGVCRSPWDPALTPGGSSGGSAAAVAAGLVGFGTGSDSGGSLRIPAAYSGLVGFKGTYGRVPRGPGYVGLPNVRHYGVLTRTVAETAAILDVIAGPDEHDPLSLPPPAVPFADAVATAAEHEGGRFAFSADLGAGACGAEIAALAADGATGLAASVGATIADRSVELPDCGDAWYALAVPDVMGLYGPYYPKCADDIAPLIGELLDRGPTMTAIDIALAAKQRDDLVQALAALFAEVDVLVTPTVGCPAFAAEGPHPSEIDGKPVDLLGSVTQTYLFNLSGHPAVSVPLGIVGGAPVGLQLVGPRHSDGRLLALAARFEAIGPGPLTPPSSQ